MNRRRWLFIGGAQFNPFDFAIIRYSWTDTQGRDLDTRTALLDVDVSVDGRDVGWPSGTRGYTVSGVSGNYLQWGGDNTDPAGTESVLVDFTRIAADFPALADITVRMRANWYGARYTGDFTLQFATYLGGTMMADGTDFLNVGGAIVTDLSRPANVVSNIAGDVDGQDVATLTYHIATRTASLTML